MGVRSLLSGGAPLLAALLVLSPPAATQGGAQKLQELEKRLAEERKQWLEFKKQARTEEERAELAAAFPVEDFVPALEALASAERASEVGARAWLACLRIGAMLDDRVLFGRALERLVGDHVESPVMAELALELVYGAPAWSAPAAAAAMRTILAKSSDKGVVAGCLGELALLVGLDPAFGAEGPAEAERLLARIEAEYGSSTFIGMSGEEFVAGARHEIGQLRLGQVAPDFEATDETGSRFKLSDYRGQVVLLDFWGFV